VKGERIQVSRPRRKVGVRDVRIILSLEDGTDIVLDAEEDVTMIFDEEGGE